MLKMPKLNGRRRKFLAALAIVLTVIFIIISIVHAMQEPAVGTISQKPSSQAEKVDPYKDPRNYNGKYITFIIPSHYKQSGSTLTGSYLEVANFSSTDHTSKYISIGVTKGNISEDSGVIFRRKSATIYKEQPRTQNSLSFTSTANGSEITTYVQLGEYDINVSLTSSTGADLSEDSQIVLGNLQLK